MFRKLPGAGGGVQTRTGVVVCAFKAFIRIQQLEANIGQQQSGEET